MRKCQNIAIESRFADGKWDRLPGLAAELTRVQVDVIVTYTTLRIRRQRYVYDASGTGRQARNRNNQRDATAAST